MKFSFKNKNIKKNKFFGLFFLFLITLFFTVNASAQELAFVDASSESSGSELLALIMGFILLIASIAGVVFVFQGILKLIGNAKNPNDPKNSLNAAMLAFIAGALLTNTYGTANIVIKSVTGTDSFCFNQRDAMTGEIKLPTASDVGCFDAQNSELTENLRERLTSEGSDSWDQFKDRFEIFLGVIQVIGMYYFIKSIFLLKTVADGRGDTGYGKILIMMLFSSIAMDLGNFITIVVNTINELF